MPLLKVPPNLLITQKKSVQMISLYLGERLLAGFWLLKKGSIAENLFHRDRRLTSFCIAT